MCGFCAWVSKVYVRPEVRGSTPGPFFPLPTSHFPLPRSTSPRHLSPFLLLIRSLVEGGKSTVNFDCYANEKRKKKKRCHCLRGPEFLSRPLDVFRPCVRRPLSSPQSILGRTGIGMGQGPSVYPGEAHISRQLLPVDDIRFVSQRFLPSDTGGAD